ncbi:MAG: hypothetical protein A3F82_05880 [Deltaproteobacteria bacterium RIFCSPLOWO2_12_FULL_44_12]|nr:MAG: hypothetical protein A2712_01425 [Deltaproteobacteria bacterium RIFCSPHIGHO2_01_FULL_43_49]OGQ15205.1 MAG: hypothetical protein A3D22_04050 [Deltaproteobacteria bacterium RIFCSPHIGHO2_02_FULL_44_53]OGQ27172.1 MAG: hypothetical protein A3D98_02015 [Deltaproteobacteria bacterium RIFCSPHIGHO2_12_FULL_44_21]OGQ31722.1 MAG: hypothetical protein A2979_05210 [Deltaproteobacteria bacterium RIFCSPLOWO2_01_FULL_45_74]OGQ42922.1 MAG: hypothetical protein A3I70_07515 [Deltaproteobacteria bacterium 
MKILIIVVAGILLWSGGALLADEQHKSQTLNMKIEGMTCGMCEAKVKRELKNLCTEAAVDYKKDWGRCVYEEGKATPEQILNAVKKTGFKGTLIP